MERIEKLDLGQLYVEEAFGLHRLMYAEIRRCEHAKVVGLCDIYRLELENWEEILQNCSVTPLAADVRALDYERTVAWQGIYRLVKVLKKHFDSEKALAAQQLSVLMRRFGRPRYLPMLEKNAQLHHLIELMEFFDRGGDPLLPESAENKVVVENAGRLTLLGLREWLDRLKETNDRYVAAFVARNETLGNRPPAGTWRTTRLAVEKACRDVIRRINALAEVEGEADFLDIIHHLNALIDRQKTILAIRATLRTQRKKGGEEKAEGEERGRKDEL